MKNSLLFLSLLMICALVLFTGCDGLLGGKDGGSLTNVGSFEVKDDSGETMTYTNESDEALLKVFIAAGMAEEGDQTSKYEDQFAGIKEYLDQAKITEDQLVALATLIEENSDIADIILSNIGGDDDAPDMTAEKIKKVLEFYKAAMGIIGNDAVGKLLYNMALKQSEGDAEAIAAIEAVGYENFVITSRVVLSIINSIIFSIDSADVDVIAPLIIEEKEPTNAEAVQLAKIAADAIGSIKLSDDVWEQYFAIVVAQMDDAAQLSPNENYPEGAKDAAKAILEFLGKYMNTNLGFIKEALNKVDESFVEVATKSKYDKDEWDNETYTFVTKYYIDDVEVTEEEYQKLEKQQMTTLFGLFVKTYKGSTNAVKTKFEAEVVDVLTALNAVVKEEITEEYVYEGEISTFADVISKLEELSNLNYATLTLAEVEEALNNGLPIVMQYIGPKAPYLFYQMQ